MHDFRPLPLCCVFQPYVRDPRAPGGARWTGPLCAKQAPRELGAPHGPRHPNRFGEPLCEAHRGKAADEVNFPVNGDKHPSAFELGGVFLEP